MRYLALIFLVTLGLTGFVTTAPSAAHAQEMSTAQQVEQLSAEGAELFGEDDFEGAIDRFTEAYELEPVPNLLFNIARCYEELEDWESAEDYYDQFVRSPDVDSEARDLAMDRITAVREIREAELEEQRQKEEQLAAKEAKEAEEEPIVEIEEPNMTPAYASLGAGLGLLAGGAAFGLMARSNANSLSDSSLSYDDRLDARSSARTQGVLADTFYVTGAAATAVGVYLFLSARSDASDLGDAQARTVAPFVDRDGAGLGLHLDF